MDAVLALEKLRTGRQFTLASVAGGRWVGDDDEFGTKSMGLFGQLGPTGVGRQANGGEPVAQRRDHIKGVDANGASRAEHGNATTSSG